MDRPLDQKEIKAHQIRKLGVLVVGLGLAVVSVVGLRWLLQPHVDGNRVRFAEVDQGPIEATIQCSGTVVPAMEQVIPSPFQARVRRLVEQPGSSLEAGQVLLELDDTQARLEVDRIVDEIALKENKRRNLGETLESRLAELAGETEIKREKLAFLEAKTEQQQALNELGLTNVYELRKARLEEKVARIELRQIEDKSGREQRANRTATEGLEIELSQLGRDLAEKQDQLEKAQVRADRPGVLIWIVDDEGSTVAKGEILARLGDLTRFRIEATVSDLHANRIAIGMMARVIVDDQLLDGHISSIPPAIDKGVMTVKIELDDPSSPLLHLNQRLDVHIVTERRPMALRIGKGPFINGRGAQDVFVVDGDTARRRRVQIGVAGIDSFEVVSGLALGERVIISNMDDFKHTERLRVR